MDRGSFLKPVKDMSMKIDKKAAQYDHTMHSASYSTVNLVRPRPGGGELAFLARFPATVESLGVLDAMGTVEWEHILRLLPRVFIAVHGFQISNLVGQRIVLVTQHGIDIVGFFQGSVSLAIQYTCTSMINRVVDKDNRVSIC